MTQPTIPVRYPIDVIESCLNDRGSSSVKIGEKYGVNPDTVAMWRRGGVPLYYLDHKKAQARATQTHAARFMNPDDRRAGR